MSSRITTHLTVIPDPVEVQKHLAQVLCEGRILRRQLRLSIRAAAEQEHRRRAQAQSADQPTNPNPDTAEEDNHV